MPINLKKLQAQARRKLELKGSVEWNPAPKNQLSNLESSFGRGFVIGMTDGKKHTIAYSSADRIDQVDVLHELCKAKLNELGFAEIKAVAEKKMQDCSKSSLQYFRDANSAMVTVAETLVNSILFSQFPEESRVKRESTIGRFESTDALTSIYTQVGFWGPAQISYYRKASLNSGIPFPGDLIEKAMIRASEEMKKEYDTVNAALEELPKIDLNIEQISKEDSIRIVGVTVQLFQAKTGLKCE